MGKIIEGVWTCNYCKKNVPGRMRSCPNCGNTRNTTTTFSLPEAKKYIPDEEAKKINKNPDWICLFCKCLNSDDDVTCKSCGAERTSENLDYFTSKKSKEKSSNIPSTSEVSDTSKSYNSCKDSKNSDFFNQTNDSETLDIQTSNSKSFHSYSENSKQNNSNKIKNIVGSIGNFFISYWKPILATTLILSVIVGIVFLFIPRNEEITITDFSWERSIAIERYQTVNESDWHLPQNARLKYSQQEIRTYEKVLDHYETSYWEVTKERKVGEKEVVVGHRDLGNGYFEEITKTEPIYETYIETESSQVPIYRQDPVYAAKYYYEIDKWLYDRTVYSNGTGQLNVKWPDVSNLSSDERSSTKQEKYFVIGYNSEEESKRFELAYDSWIKLESGQKVTVKYTVFGTGEIIE